MDNEAALLAAIEDFADKHLPKDVAIRHEKVIHDTIWGTNVLYGHEVSILDTPLLQRLRDIHQTGLAHLTYPSSTHTRFEHSLGVLTQCFKLAETLSRKDDYEGYFEESDILEIRLAALLHDIGHSLFSHSSEEIYQNFDVLAELTAPKGKYPNYHAGELLSRLILDSNVFREFFKKLNVAYGLNLKLADIQDCITGTVSDPLKRYKIQIVNGPFDADKLDYIFRDSHFTGLPLVVDLDRLWYSVGINFYGEWDDDQKRYVDPKTRRIAVEVRGTAPLEQVFFSKMVLFSTVYHHHKVRAADCLLKAILELARCRGGINGKKLQSLGDFFWLTDRHIFNIDPEDQDLVRLTTNLEQRNLFKRALVITGKTIDKADDQQNPNPGYERLQRLTQPLPISYKELRRLARLVWEEAGKPCLAEEVWIDFPKLPSKRFDVEQVGVQVSKDELLPLQKLIPIDIWVQQYGIYKWRGHVFCPEDLIPKIQPAAISVLEKEFGIKFNQLAKSLCRTKV